MAYPGRPRSGLGFIPAECLVLHRDVGFQWLCGEPVPEEVRPLLATSNVPDPVTEDVIPPGTPDPDQPGHVIPGQAGAGGDTVEVVEGDLTSAGFGILPLVASLIMGAALSSILER